MAVKNPFIPPRYLRNPHIQSILNSLGPRKIRAKRLIRVLDSESLILTTEEGVRLGAEFDVATATKAPRKNALVILLHGWEGSSKSAYQVTTAAWLLDHGFDVLRLNLRDHGETQHLNRDIFNSTMTSEVADAIAVFLIDHEYPAVFLAGFSLGGSFTLRIAADYGDTLGLTAVVAISPPVDPNTSMNAIDNTLIIYEKYFFYRWTKSLRKKLVHFPEHNFGAELDQAKTLDDMNVTFINRFTPFPDAKSYFSAYALTGDRLKALTIPAHLIASIDDPIIPIADIEKINRPASLKIDIQRYGGHCGFITNLAANSWIEPRLVEILDEYLVSNG
jgi:predicted alpha/beta-fold hydrolase